MNKILQGFHDRLEGQIKFSKVVDNFEVPSNREVGRELITRNLKVLEIEIKLYEIELQTNKKWWQFWK